MALMDCLLSGNEPTVWLSPRASVTHGVVFFMLTSIDGMDMCCMQFELEPEAALLRMCRPAMSVEALAHMPKAHPVKHSYQGFLYKLKVRCVHAFAWCAHDPVDSYLKRTRVH